MRRIFSLILAITMTFSMVLTVSADEVTTYGLVDTLTDGKEYVMVWNSSATDNAGDKHALAIDDEGVFGNNKLPSSHFNGDNYKLNAYFSFYVWIAHQDGDGWRFENKDTGLYLGYDTSDEDGLTLVSDNTGKDTLWAFKKSTGGCTIHASSNSSYRIRYSTGNEYIRLQSGSSSNSYVYLYELGTLGCPKHTYNGCLDTICADCGKITRLNSGLSHKYADKNDATCGACGFERYIFPEEEIADNCAERSFSAVFYPQSSSTKAAANFEYMFDITGLVASVAPLEYVTHADITVEVSNIEGNGNKVPSCKMYVSQPGQKQLGLEKFDGVSKVSFSADIDDSVSKIWLVPENFVSQTEISFKITATVTYDELNEPDYGEPLATVVTFSDYQHWDINGLHSQLDGIFSAMHKRVNPDYIIFGGDYTTEMHVTYASDEGRKEVLGFIGDWWPHINAENGNYIQIQGNHDPDDMAGMLETGPLEFDELIVYNIQEQDFPCGMGSDSARKTVEATAQALEKYLNKCIRSGEQRPIIIASHLGLHYEAREGSNTQYIYILFDVINEAATNLDIIYMHGHFHSTGDPESGGAIVYFPVGSTLNVADESCFDAEGKALQDRAGHGRPSVLNFTYMNYGYVGYVLENLIKLEPFAHLEPEYVLTGGALNIYDEFITLDRYASTGKIGKFSQVIPRAHADAKPKLLPQDYIYVVGGGAILIVIILAVVIIAKTSKSKKK